MKLTGFLGKPRWLSKDAATRRMAILHDQDDELVAALGRIAREDTDAGVRAAAMKRLADPRIAQGLAHDDADPGVRAQARAMWLELLTGTHAAAPPLDQRLRLLQAQDDDELVAHVARNAREPAMRRAALDRIARPALLFDRALADADAGIRLALVERIDDEAQLARLAERARKSDKQVSRRARERIESLRIARGDDVTVEQRARLLCEQLEQCVREPEHADVEAQIATRWHAIEASVASQLRARYQAARELLAASRSASTRPLPATQTGIATGHDAAEQAPALAPAGDAAPEVAAVPLPASDEIVAPLLAQARFAASLDEASVARRQHREQQLALLDEVEEALRACDVALEAGASTQAHAAKSRVDALRSRIEMALTRPLAQHLAATEKRYAEFSQWQRWADNQRRRQICEEIEALASGGLHPDAVATRIRDAQHEWTRLDIAEGVTRERAGGTARRFHAACRAALAPAQGYFRKRQELRQTHGARVNALLERLGALAEESADWPAIATLRSEIVEALRGLDRVEPRERKLLAQRLKGGLTDLDGRLARRDAEVQTAKSALIAEAEALGQATPQRGAVAAARDLQQRWQRIGNGRRARDQAQWKAFRTALDAVFGRLDAERSERSARDADARARAMALCAELESLADGPPAERGAIARLQSGWSALGIRDSDLSRRFDAALARLRDAAVQQERARRNARFEAWLQRYRLCRGAECDAESGDSLRERWAGATTTDIAAPKLSQRFDAAVRGTADAAVAGDAEAFSAILFELEYLAGVESSEADREKRRALQVARLSARLRGETESRSPADQLARLLARWTDLGVVPDSGLDARLEHVLAIAIETLP